MTPPTASPTARPRSTGRAVAMAGATATAEAGPGAGPILPVPASLAAPDHVTGLRCRNCDRVEALGADYVCPACFGPLEVVYDYAIARERLTRSAVASRPTGIWRYLELLPVGAVPARALAVGGTPLVVAARLADTLGLERLWLKDDTRNPTLSFKDRVVAVAAARAIEFGFDTLACASTGNLAGATAAAAARLGLRAFVFVPADVEPAKIDHALAYGATVVPVEGSYDQINRLSLEIAEDQGWAFVNVNLRPFYSEGSKTLAFEVAEQLGWRLPDAVVAPIASGSLFTKLAKGFRELVEVGLVEPKAVRFVGAQPEGCSPVATAFASDTDRIVPVREPRTLVKSLAIGDPADGRYAVELARGTGGSIEAVPDVATARSIERLARQEGIFAETAAGATIAALEQAIRRGVVSPDEETVAFLTGNGVKTPEARGFGVQEIPGSAAEAGLARPIQPTLSAFEAWFEA